MYKYDGIWYQKKSDAPDLGSLSCVEAHGPDDMIRQYSGKKSDYSKLPKYASAGISRLSLMTGSTFIAADTGEVFTYVAADKTWYQTA